jgi:hypothetical protein
MTLKLQLSLMVVFSHCMWTVGPSDSNHAVEQAVTVGKWLCHCTQFWLQQAHCLEVLKDCHRELHHGLLHAAAGGICNLFWNKVNRIFCNFHLFGSLFCGTFWTLNKSLWTSFTLGSAIGHSLWTFLPTNATSLMEQLIPLVEGCICWWFPTKLHIKSPLRHNLRFIFVISEHALSFGHWNTVFQNCSISKTWKLQYCNIETASYYLPA